MNIRKGKKEDYDIVPEMMLQAMEEVIFSFIGKKDIEESIQFLTELYRKTNNQYSFENTFIAEDEDENIIGTLTAYDGDLLEKLRKPVLEIMKAKYNIDIIPENETEGNEFYLDTISVSPHCQGQGIGSKLLQYAITFAKDNGFKQVGLLVDLENPDAQRLYERVGFVLGKKTPLVGGEYYHMYIKF